jgi:hypothetical protein
LPPRATNLDRVLDPWLAQEPDETKRRAVIEAVLWALEHLDELQAQPAFEGHPLKRLVEVPEAEVALRILLPLPMSGVHLLSIDPL